MTDNKTAPPARSVCDSCGKTQFERDLCGQACPPAVPDAVTAALDEYEQALTELKSRDYARAQLARARAEYAALIKALKLADKVMCYEHNTLLTEAMRQAIAAYRVARKVQS